MRSDALRLGYVLAACLFVLGACDCDASGGDGERDGSTDDAQTDDAQTDDAGTDGAADADPCAADAPPVMTGSVADVGFPIGSGTAAYMLTFDEPVTIAAGAITVDGGATIAIEPALPATATAFMVTLTGLFDGTDYHITLADDAAVDACSHALDGAITVAIVSACVGDMTAPTITSALDPIPLDFDGTSVTYTLTFDEMVALDAGAISLVGAGATVTVTPTLPAVAASFTVELTGLTDMQSYDLDIVAASVADRCGTALAADAGFDVVGVCVNDTTAPTITSSLADLVLAPGATTLEYTLTFDDVVALDASAITATGGATVVVDPALPAESDTFTVSLSGLSAAEDYTIAIDAAHAADRCEIGLAAGAEIDVFGACVGNLAPTITSAAIPRQFPGSTFTHVVTFDEPVLLGASAITIDNGAAVAVTPVLPAIGTSFEVVLSGLVDGTGYTVTIDADAVADVCGAKPAADQSFTLDGCGGDVTPPTITSDTAVPLCTPPGTITYTLALDEVTYVPAGAISATGGTITSVTPALPAYSDTFEVVMALAGASTLSLDAGVVGDCGGASPAISTVTITPWVAQSMTFSYTGAIVPFEVPASECGVTIEVWGAQGGQNTSSTTQSGLGARMRGMFTTLPSQSLLILVGEQPSMGSGNGGGGGSFVVTSTNVPLVIAGGGGGSSQTTDGAYKHGTTATSGQSCPADGGTGGADGNGGTVGPIGFQAAAGGGLLTSGADGWTAGTGGASFLLGGAGGPANNTAHGGFGGGGSGSSYVVGGGGGGYSGGAGCGNTGSVAQVGAGGGSYNAGTMQDNEGGVRSGHGQVTITW